MELHTDLDMSDFSVSGFVKILYRFNVLTQKKYLQSSNPSATEGINYCIVKMT